MPFTFTTNDVLDISQCYVDPYDAYENRLIENKQLSLIINGIIVEHLDTKLISVRWAIACAKRVLPIFERWNSDDKRPRRAIEVAELWGLKPNAARAVYASDAYAAYDAANDAAYDAANDAAYVVVNADANAAKAAYYAANAALPVFSAADDSAAFYAAKTADYASYSVSRETEIQWQRSQLRKIIKEYCKYYKKFNKLLCQRYPPELSSLIISNIF